MLESKINWKKAAILAVITMTFTLIATVIGGILLDYWQTQTTDSELVYFTENTIPFSGENENVAIYHVGIVNSGNKIIEDVTCQLSFPNAMIGQYRITIATSISYDETVTNNSYRVDILNLNPKESATISIFASSSDNLPTRPQISLRGKGVNGKEASLSTEERGDLELYTIGIAIIAVFSALWSMRIFRVRISPKLALDDASKDEGDQRLILSYLCGLNGLKSESERYLNLPHTVKYWSEADRFSMLALEDPKSDKSEKLKKVLKELLKYSSKIAPRSKGLALYNIARIEKGQGNEDEANKHLEEAKKIIPKLIKTRVELDPVFKNKQNRKNISKQD